MDQTGYGNRNGNFILVSSPCCSLPRVFSIRRRRVVIALIAMALGCLLFSFGPGIYFTHPPPLGANQQMTLHCRPSGRQVDFCDNFPGFNNLRGWARLGFFVELSVGLLAAAGLARLLDWMKEQLHARAFVQVGVAAIVMGLVVIDFFPRPAAMSAVSTARGRSCGFQSNRAILHSLSIRYQDTAMVDPPSMSAG